MMEAVAQCLHDCLGLLCQADVLVGALAWTIGVELKPRLDESEEIGESGRLRPVVLQVESREGKVTIRGNGVVGRVEKRRPRLRRQRAKRGRAESEAQQKLGRVELLNESQHRRVCNMGTRVGQTGNECAGRRSTRGRGRELSGGGGGDRLRGPGASTTGPGSSRSSGCRCGGRGC